MDIVATLRDLNFTDREAQVYVALLGMGSGTPLTIANKTGLKRPTVYLVLEDLRRKRVIGLLPRGKKHVYVAESPGQLFLLLEEQQRSLKMVAPYLRGLMAKSPILPQVRLYEEEKEIRDLLRSIWEFPDRCYISQYHGFTSIFDDLMREYFTLRYSKGFPSDRAIVSYHPNNIKLATRYNTRQYQIRVLPQNYEFDTDFTIWGDNIGLYSLEGRFLFVLKNAAITKAFRTLFNLAWAASTSPRQSTPVKNNPAIKRKPR